MVKLWDNFVNKYVGNNILNLLEEDKVLKKYLIIYCIVKKV